MSEMIERVAKAIYDRTLEDDQLADYGLPMADAITCAKAAIEAMREPTQDMLNAGKAIMTDYDDSLECWQAMIDEALK